MSYYVQLCSTSLLFSRLRIIRAHQTLLFTIIVIRHFLPGHKMVYLRKGNYVAVVNPLSFSEILSNDATISYGVYDTVTREFFSVSDKADARALAPFARSRNTDFQNEGRFWSIVLSGKRPIAVAVSTSDAWFWQAWRRQMSVMLPLGLVMGRFAGFSRHAHP